MKKTSLIFFMLISLISCRQNTQSDFFVANVQNPIISLNGTWKINITPDKNFQKNKVDTGWQNIQVPGECQMQGFAIKHDIPFVYAKQFNIPTDYKGKTVKLCFEGVYSYAKVWINGNFVREHNGGFTTWECDITPFVNAGEKADLFVEVTDKTDDISYASGYALHMIGGILRNVKLMALPKIFPEKINISTDFDDEYKNAKLTINGKLNRKAEDAVIKIELTDKKGKSVELKNSRFDCKNSDSFTVENIIKSPDKWDAEHPNLYRLEVSCFADKKLLYVKNYSIGFREIEIEGKKMFVNGVPVKLRGACRHDIHPLLGRVSTPDYELKDVRLAKEANINFIRTSHYPPTANFLSLCDKYGIYTEVETAVCFVDTWRREGYSPAATQNDTAYTTRYMSQLDEMISTHRNHPSVIIWSVGNENKFGTNFKKSYDYVKASDKTRPVMFSYTGYVPDSIKAYDITSVHYPDIHGNKDEFGLSVKNFESGNKPVLCDEWTHSPCYNFRTIKTDPNVRDFWGQSLDSMWTNIFETEGGLGGAIWGMIDESFMLPDTLPGFEKWWGKDQTPSLQRFQGHTVGSGEWGIVDTWRRKKPEFWNTKKAYSPFKILKTEFVITKNDSVLNIPIYNRFNHTDFNELIIKYNAGNREIMLPAINLAPHKKGVISIPLENINNNNSISISAFNKSNLLIDKYVIRLNINNKQKTEKALATIDIKETNNLLTVICKNQTNIIFDKTTGLIQNIKTKNGSFLLSGPFINLKIKGKPIDFMRNFIDDYGKDFILKTFSYKKDKEKVTVSLTGETEKLSQVDFGITINPNAQISVNYTISDIPQKYISQIGVRFDVDNNIDSLSWQRNGYRSCYPPNHLSANKGSVALYSDIQKVYRKLPTKNWSFDTKSFYYDGTANEETSKQLCFIAKATKEHIAQYSLSSNGKKLLCVEGQGDANCRIAANGDKLSLFINNKIDYINLGWGNYQRNIKLDKTYSDRVVLSVH